MFATRILWQKNLVERPQYLVVSRTGIAENLGKSWQPVLVIPRTGMAGLVVLVD